ncbi:MAG: outer membrane lipoprotein carrier protein LolA [Halomonadaceae bacterium]|nr:MAG: outer membrane lipoprotein carrier protein LolA [Halomonadaceae bacterium]
MPWRPPALSVQRAPMAPVKFWLHHHRGINMTMTKRTSGPLLLVLTLMLSVALPVAANGDEDQAAALSAKLSNYTTFQASFTQYLADSRGEKVQETHGDLKARRPGYFYWRTDPPMEQVIVSNGTEVTVYDPDLLQATVYPMDQQLSATPALLLSGEIDDLAESFRISHEQVNSNSERFTLEPRQPDSMFLQLRLLFVDGVLDEMRLFDAMEQLSVLMFDDVVLNEDIADDRFTIDLDDSVDVIREQGRP